MGAVKSSLDPAAFDDVARFLDDCAERLLGTVSRMRRTGVDESLLDVVDEHGGVVRLATHSAALLQAEAIDVRRQAEDVRRLVGSDRDIGALAELFLGSAVFAGVDGGKRVLGEWSAQLIDLLDAPRHAVAAPQRSDRQRGFDRPGRLMLLRRQRAP